MGQRLGESVIIAQKDSESDHLALDPQLFRGAGEKGGRSSLGVGCTPRRAAADSRNFCNGFRALFGRTEAIYWGLVTSGQ